MRKKTIKKTVKVKTASKAKKTPAKNTSVSVKAHTRSYPNSKSAVATARKGKTSGALLAGAAIVGALLYFKGRKKNEETNA